MKCRAIVDRTFAYTNPGDPIRVTWPEYGLDGVVFRVAQVTRGTSKSSKITMELVQDHFYVFRQEAYPTPPVDSFPGWPGGGGVLIEDP
jgi:hypothetical protein